MIAVTVNHNTPEYTKLTVESFKKYHNIPLTVLESKKIPNINTHGEILADFVLSHHPDYFLFLDSDIYFTSNVTDEMVKKFKPNIFGVQANETKFYNSDWQVKVKHARERVDRNGTNVYWDRINPFCCMIKNTPLFRWIVKEIGLSTYVRESSDFLHFDTFGMMTVVYKMAGYAFDSSGEVFHFGGTSYKWNPEEINMKNDKLRNYLLNNL